VGQLHALLCLSLFFIPPATADISTLSLHDALPICTARFSHARISPRSTFSRLNSSRLPSFLITMRGFTSTVSKVVNRLPQLSHSRRRRIDFPSLAGRESSTRLPIDPQ